MTIRRGDQIFYIQSMVAKRGLTNRQTFIPLCEHSTAEFQLDIVSYKQIKINTNDRLLSGVDSELRLHLPNMNDNDDNEYISNDKDDDNFRKDNIVFWATYVHIIHVVFLK